MKLTRDRPPLDMDALQRDIDREWRGEVLSLSDALWQNGEMHLDGPDILAALAVDHLRARGWLMPDLVRRAHAANNKLWWSFWFVFVIALLFMAVTVWLATA